MNEGTDPRIPLDEATEAVAPPADDRRLRMAEPLPVRLVTVEDARLIAANGDEASLNAFYLDMLGFERSESEEGVVFRADNFRLIFRMRESPIVRSDMRALGIEVLSLQQVEQKLIDAGIEYVHQKSFTPGRESLLLQDPGGNWIELCEVRKIR